MTSPDPRPTSRPVPAGGSHYWDSLTTPLRFRYFSAAAVTTGAGKATHTNTSGNVQKIVSVSMTAGTAPTGADLIADVNIGGTSIFATAADRPKIVAGQTSGFAVVDDEPDDEQLIQPGGTATIDIDQIGSTVAGANVEIVVVLAEVATGGYHWKELRDGAVITPREGELLPLDVNPA